MTEKIHIKKDVYFSPTQIGYIAKHIEPIHIASDAKWSFVFKEEELDAEVVIPVERHGSIQGLIRREEAEKLAGSSHASVNRFLGKSVSPLLMRVHEFVDASASIKDVVERGLQTVSWDDPGWYVVEYKQKYTGIVNLRQMMEYLEEIMSRDLQRAGEIQKNILVQPTLNDSRFSFLSFNRMANKVGGDWYKPLRISKDLYLFGCFDVAGKNVSGALVSMALGTSFATLEMVSYHGRGGNRAMRKWDSPEQITALLNTLIRKVSPPDVFVAAALVYVNFFTKVVEIHNCGLGPVTVFLPSGEQTVAYKTYKPNLPPLGLGADTEQDPDPPHMIPISDGLRIVVYSDGLSDMSDAHGERYGDDRTVEFLQNLHFVPDDEYATFVGREVDLWTKDAALADDVTLFELRFKNPVMDTE